MMDNNFSSDIQRLLERSKKEALRHNNSSISPAHLLIAMLSEIESTPSRLIEKASTSASAYELKQQLDEYLFNESNGPIKELSVSDLTNRIVKLSVLEARLMKAQPVDTIHILLALFHNYEVQNMKYMQPFLNAGVTYDKLYSLARDIEPTPTAGSDFISEDDDDDMPKSSDEPSSGATSQSSQPKGKRSRRQSA